MAQNATLTFEAPRHDFQTIKEDGGTVAHTFSCINNSTEPIVILSVSGGCSCTKANFSKKPILPAQKSTIEVIFDPMNQIEGNFIRKVIVSTSKGNIPLTISGHIVPRKRSIAEQYPIILDGGIRIDANAHAFGYIEQGQVLRSSFSIINTSKHSVKLSITPHTQSGLLTIHYPRTIAAGEQAAIDFGYAIPQGGNIYGQLSDVLSVEIDGKRAYYQLIISAIAIDKRNIGADKEWQKIQLSKNFIKFGPLKRSIKEAVRNLEITNIGIEPLIIRKIEGDKGLFSTAIVGSSVIPSDGKAVLRVTFRPSEGDYGAITERIRIFSNDPQYPVVSIRVSVIVEE